MCEPQVEEEKPPTEDRCQFCGVYHAPLAVMVAMLVRNPRMDFIIYPACNDCYSAVVEHAVAIRTARVVTDWPPPRNYPYKVWSQAEYSAYYADQGG